MFYVTFALLEKIFCRLFLPCLEYSSCQSTHARATAIFCFKRTFDTDLQGAAKSNPLKFFAVFSATAWHFNLKFYRFISQNFYI